MFTPTVAEPGAVPEAGLKLSHVALSLTDQLRVPPPVLVTLTIWAEGFAPPCTPVKPRLVGLRPIVGDGGGGDDDGGGGGEAVCVGGERMASTSGRWVSFRK